MIVNTVIDYPLVNVYITLENHHFSWDNSLYIAIFNSYISLLEGIWGLVWDLPSGVIKCGRWRVSLNEAAPGKASNFFWGIVHCLVCWREIIIWLVVNSG